MSNEGGRQGRQATIPGARDSLPSVTTLPGTYPGAKGLKPFTPADDETLWILDFHAPQGLTPLGLGIVEAVTRASREAADAVPMPQTHGLAERVAGSHVYLSPLAVTPDEAAARAEQAPERLATFLDDPRGRWERAASELATQRHVLRAEERGIHTLADARRFLAHAFAAAEHAWRVHFDFMYPLLAAHFTFVDLVEGLGVPAPEIPPLLQGFPTRITETDRAIWGLAEAAIELGLEGALRSTDPTELTEWLRVADGAGARFREHLGAFLEKYGWRMEGIYDVSLVPWIDDPGPVLARVKMLLDEVEQRSYADMEAASATARDQAERAIIERLDELDRRAFRRALSEVRDANFAWWNEDHNPSIDLCAHIPVRRAALAVGSIAGLPAPEDALYLSRAELEELADGQLSASEAMAAIPERRQLHRTWAVERGAFAPLVGTRPEHVDDPVLREIFGLSEQFAAEAASQDRTSTALHGISAAAGVARGPARVVRRSADLAHLKAGEIIVCEATTPSWTPAFAAVAACVCDQGGSLTHAAIVSREYGVPCVTGTVRATELIRTGDLLEVDGEAGVVTVLERSRP